MKSIRKEIEKIRVKKWIQISKYCFLIGQLSSVYDQKRRLLNFIFHYLTFSEYKGLNEKLLLFLPFVLSETELSKLSAILDLSDLSELSAKHELAISKSMLINRFILVILRSPKCNWLISGGELVFYIYISQWEIKVAHHSGDRFDL